MRVNVLRSTLAVLTFIQISMALSMTTNTEALVYFGTYTSADTTGSKGIYLSRLNFASGLLSTPELAVEAENPSFLCTDRSKRYLFGVNEVSNFRGEGFGAVSSFAINPQNGTLALRSQVPSGGNGPCYVSTDPVERPDSTATTSLFAANFGSGSIAALRADDSGNLTPQHVVQHTGSSIDPKRQAGPHAHAMVPDAAGNFVIAIDLGMDQILAYPLDQATGKLQESSPTISAVTPGFGPRHLAFHPNGQFAYVTNELSNTVSVHAYNSEKGTFSLVQTIKPSPEDFTERNYPSEVAVHPSGKFVYTGNRGHDSIAMFAVQTDGTLSLVALEPTQGKFPRHFALDSGGRYLIVANQKSNSVVLFRINGDSGRLESTGVVQTIVSPSAVLLIDPPGVCLE